MKIKTTSHNHHKTTRQTLGDPSLTLRMTRRNFMACCLIFFPVLGFAFFCPTNFSQIAEGDSLAKVIATCGAPSKQETKEEVANTPQEWSYFIPQTVALSANQEGQGTLKTTMNFDKDGRVINISVNGIGVGATAICGRNVQLGDKQDSIKAACGDPSLVEKPATSSPPAKKKVTTLTYVTNPPKKLIFENDVLVRQE